MYTAKQIMQERISFKPMTKKQFKKLEAHFKKLYPECIDKDLCYVKNNYYRFYLELHTNRPGFYSTTSYLSRRSNDLKASKEISFEEFDFEDEFILPAKWCVKRDTHEKSLILSEWANKVSDTFAHTSYSEFNFIHSENVDIHSFSPRSSEKQEGFTEITFEQFKKYVLNQNNMNKKIIGYKCPTSLFRDLIKEGTVYKSTNSSTTHVYGDYIPDDKQVTADRFKLPAEIVETWEPVYEEQFKAGDWVVVLPEDSYYNNCEQGKAQKIIDLNSSGSITLEFSNGTLKSYSKVRRATPEEISEAQTKVVRMGGENGFDLVIKGDKVFHKTDDITLYVEDIYETYNDLLSPKEISKGSQYAFHPKDLIIKKTGCQNKDTMLTEWLALYEMIKK